MMRALTIGQVAKVAGVAARTIRYYESVGVLPAPGRTRAGYRQYDRAAVHRVRFVARARSLGLPLRELQRLAGPVSDRPRRVFRPRVVALVRARLRAVRQQIGDLESLEGELRQVLLQARASKRRSDAEGCRCLDVRG